MNKNLEELSKDIDNLEKELFNTQSEPVENTTESVVQPTPTPNDEIEKLKEELAVAVKRFNNYKGSTDTTIHDLRTQLASTKQQHASLQQEYSKLVREKNELLEKSARDNIFSDEDKDILGETAIESISKGMEKILDSKVKPLEQELQKSKEALIRKEKEEASKIAKQAYNKFLERLGKQIPNFASINVDKGFMAFLKEVDEVSGFTKEYLFTKAEEALDAGRVATFFEEYLKRVNPSKAILDNNLTPVAGSSTTKPVAPQTETKVIDRKFIDNFYDDLIRGKYKGKKGREEADRIEAMIERAVMTGRVV